MLYMVTWIPSIYPLDVSIYASTMDPSWGTKNVGPHGNGRCGWWIPNGSAPGWLHEALEQQRTHHDGCSGGCECPQVLGQEKYLVGKLT